MIKEALHSKADDIYFAIIEYLGIEDKCIRDTEDGTEDTEYGRELFFIIDDKLQELADDS